MFFVWCSEDFVWLKHAGLHFLSDCIVQEISTICLISALMLVHYSWGAVPSGAYEGSAPPSIHYCELELPVNMHIEARVMDSPCSSPHWEAAQTALTLHCTHKVARAPVLYSCHLLWQNSSIILANDLLGQKPAQPLGMWQLHTKNRLNSGTPIITCHSFFKLSFLDLLLQFSFCSCLFCTVRL